MSEIFGFIVAVFKFIVSAFESASGFILSLGLKGYFLEFDSFLRHIAYFLGGTQLSLFSVYFIIISSIISYFMSGNFIFIFRNISLYLLFVVYYIIFGYITRYDSDAWTYVLSGIAFLFVSLRVLRNIHDNLLKREVEIVAKKFLENQKKEKNDSAT